MYILRDNIKIDLKEIIKVEVGWIHLPQDRGWCFYCEEVPGSTPQHQTKEENRQNISSKSHKIEHHICYLLDFLQRNHLKMTYQVKTSCDSFYSHARQEFLCSYLG